LRDLLRRGVLVQPLYVRSGVRWERDEIAVLRKFLRALRSNRLRSLAIIDVPMADLYGRHWSTGGRGTPGFRAGDESVYLPGRNIALLSKAATFCAMRGIPTLARRAPLESFPRRDAGVLPRPRQSAGPRS